MKLRASIDSNILVYAALEPLSDKGRRAISAIQRLSGNGILAAQALLEFVAVVRRRTPELTPKAFSQIEAWSNTFEIAPTTIEVAGAARVLVERHKFQVWDAVILSAARLSGATLFFSEDLQHGFTLDGVRILNPFALSESEIDQLLS